MSTVSTSLKLNDQMTGILRGVMNSLNLTLSAMEDLKKSMGDSFNDKPIQAARKSIRDTEAALKSIPASLQENERRQRDVNRQIEEGEKAMDNLAKKVLGVVAAYLSFRSVARGVNSLIASGIERASRVETTQIAITTMMGSEDAASKFMDDLLDFAKTTPFQFPDLADASRNLLAFGMDARNVLPVMNAIGNAVAGVGGGRQELVQIADAFGAMQIAGKVSLAEINRLHAAGVPALQILANQAGITADAMRGQISKGALDANTAIAALVKGIEHGTDGIAGKTAAFGGMMANYGGTWVGAVDSLRGAWGRAGQAIMEKHMPMIIAAMGQLTQVINGLPETLDPIFILFAFLFEQIAQGVFALIPHIQTFIEYMGMAATIIIDNWSLISPILLGLGTTLLVFISYLALTKTWTMLVAAATWAWNMALRANPIMLIVSLIAGLISALIYLWKTNDQFAIGLLSAWYAILNFFSRIPIFFDRVVIGIVNAFMDARTKSLQVMEDLVNGVIDGINKLINVLNSIPGVQLQAISNVSFAARAAVQAESVRRAGERHIRNLESQAALKEMERAMKLANFESSRMARQEEQKVKKLFDSPEYVGSASLLEGLSGLGGAGGTGKKPNIGKVDEIGRIKDTVDISSEDLKMLLELAEMRNIQNFVTLTPQISVQTGDIRETANVDEIIYRITARLEEELISSASGVYA